MNPILSFPTQLESAKIRRKPHTGLQGFPPVGDWLPTNLPNMLWEFDGFNGVSLGANNITASSYTAVGMPDSTYQNLNYWTSKIGNVTLQTTSTHPQIVRSRLHPSLPVFHCDGTDGSYAFATPIKLFASRNFSCFCFMRRRRHDATGGQEPRQGGIYVLRFTGGAVSFDYKFAGLGSGANCYHQIITDNFTDRGANAVSVLSNTFDLIGFTIDAAGNINFYENNRRMAGGSAMNLNWFNGFQIGNTSVQYIEQETFGIVAYQYCLTSEEVKSLGRYYRSFLPNVPPDGPTTSLTETGDSIQAGYPYIDTNNRCLRTIGERIAVLDGRLRYGDASKSGTYLADSAAFMATADAGANAGLDGVHSAAYYRAALHVIEHGRNDLAIGDSVATVLAAMQTVINTTVAAGWLAFPCEVINTLFTTTTTAAVACMSTANLTLSGEQTIDGFATSASRVGAKNQTNPAENGVYVSAAGAWARATDMDTSAELLTLRVPVTNGTVNAGTWWRITNTATIVVGTDAITIVKVNYTTQNQFDQNVIDYNAGLTGLTSFTAIIPLGQDAAFTSSPVGSNNFLNAGYYIGDGTDKIHVNGGAGADKMRDIQYGTLKAYIK